MNAFKFSGMVFVLALFAVTTTADSNYNANYEIELMIGQQSSSIRTRTVFNQGELIKHEFGRHHVTMMVDEQNSTDYVLKIKVVYSSSTESDENLMEQQFPGNYGSILEFEAINPDIALNGAIIVGLFKN